MDAFSLSLYFYSSQFFHFFNLERCRSLKVWSLCVNLKVSTIYRGCVYCFFAKVFFSKKKGICLWWRKKVSNIHALLVLVLTLVVHFARGRLEEKKIKSATVSPSTESFYLFESNQPCCRNENSVLKVLFPPAKKKKKTIVSYVVFWTPSTLPVL